MRQEVKLVYRKDTRYRIWGFLNTYVSKWRNISGCRRTMVDSALESWWFILLSSEKILVIRTHPEELHVVKCARHTHISTHSDPHRGQQMLTKCYVDRQGCSYDFQRWNVWPFDVPKPCQTSSQDVPSPLIKPPFGVKKPVWCIGITHDTAF